MIQTSVGQASNSDGIDGSPIIDDDRITDYSAEDLRDASSA